MCGRVRDTGINGKGFPALRKKFNAYLNVSRQDLFRRTFTMVKSTIALLGTSLMAADISFASLNLYNFQKSGLKTYGSSEVTQTQFDEKVAWVRRCLIELDADVVALQELWHPECLDTVLDTPELADYQTVYIGDEWYNIAVAIIVRRPWVVSASETIKTFPFEQLVKVDEDDGEDDEVEVKINKFSRTIIKATIQHSDDTRTPSINVFACHLKSKLASRVRGIDSAYASTVGSAISTIRRTAEATALRMLLIDHMAGEATPTVVLGDLNDDPQSNTLSLITQQPSITKRARGGDKALYSTLFLQQLQSFRDVYYTHEHNHHKSVIDHILVSEEFFEHSSDAVWRHDNTRIWSDHIEDTQAHTSDHGIIKASFK